MASASKQNLEESLRDIFVLAEAALSATSISSTITASDLPGAGRILGNLYSFLGKRLEETLNRLAERCGYGPRAIEDRILRTCHKLKDDMYEDLAVELGTKNERLLWKDLKKLIASNIKCNREAAFTIIASIAVVNPRFSIILRDLGAIQELGLACVREEDYMYTSHLLSPSRKALVSVLENNVNKTGYDWASAARTIASFEPKTFMHLERASVAGVCIEGLNKYGLLVAFVGSNNKYKTPFLEIRSPEESYLATLHLTKLQKIPAHFFWSLPDADVQEIGHHLHRVNSFLAQIIHHKVTEEPNYIDWPSLALLIGRLQHDFLLVPGCTKEVIGFVHQLIGDILVMSHDKIPVRIRADVIADHARMAQLL
ncbi:uncharacterized protein FOMMEDRAFT_31373 [Fomitiporia mediterranea MF3/22]|uniref:uncharacterized protein n=1 Tax=Fomitiporia mediterranea (strain MF3/22) TaxID=694068 RepID=UPI000440889C|nr:uncharacterized protein FOMMEDRAFT_31373 [Fomitiporia mediterranea MF3/22]EJC99313.1 hypothetical protein FOMMEDRAFT_31373 [Fomitiporia mediterranea MF3/22]